jgi:pSer/pThr/pTyr-binding forkhead associated (FHA) protein
MGRGASASTRLDDPTVSREHARVQLEAGRVLVEDLGSRNGSWLGGSRLGGPREMAPGQELRAGRTVLALGIVPPPGGDDAPAPLPRPVRPFPGRPSRVALLAAATAAAAALLAL